MPAQLEKGLSENGDAGILRKPMTDKELDDILTDFWLEIEGAHPHKHPQIYEKARERIKDVKSLEIPNL